MAHLELSDELLAKLQNRAQQQGLSLEVWFQELASGAIEQDKYLLQQFYRRSADLFAILDYQFHLRKANPRVYETFGYTAKELGNINGLSLVHPDDYKQAQTALEYIRNGGHAEQFEHRCIHKDGTLIWLQWSAHFDAAQSLLYGVARDITARKLIE